MNLPTGNFPVDPPHRVSLEEYEALVMTGLQLQAQSSPAKEEPHQPEKYECWKDPFRL